MSENKAIRIQLSERPLAQDLFESSRKIEELEKIIDVLRHELESLRISQDTSRMQDVLMKTVKLNHTKNPNARSSSTMGFQKNDKKFILKSHVTREKMRRDKIIKELKEITPSDHPSFENMKRLFKTLSDTFKTTHIGEMVQKAEESSLQSAQ